MLTSNRFINFIKLSELQFPEVGGTKRNMHNMFKQAASKYIIGNNIATIEQFGGRLLFAMMDHCDEFLPLHSLSLASKSVILNACVII